MIFAYVFRKGKTFTIAYRDFNLKSSTPDISICPGFKSHDHAVEWFLIRYHNTGTIISKESFDKMIQELLHRNPVTPKALDPNYMVGLDRPRQKKGGKTTSDFE